MTDNKQTMIAAEMAKIAAEVLESKKGLDVTVLSVTKQTVLADYFVIATGTVNTHVKALADEVEFKLKEAGYECGHIEGHGDWVLMDYHSVIVHVFTKAARDFYKLEKLWDGAEAVSEDIAE